MSKLVTLLTPTIREDRCKLEEILGEPEVDDYLDLFKWCASEGDYIQTISAYVKGLDNAG